MATKRTKDQEKAIVTIDENIVVNAGAGTGKTKVLTERYIHILEYGDLEEGKEIESIVAITFTKKATQEMKERIRSEIKKKFTIDKKWRNYYKDLEKSNISTIHSFCGNILKENPIEAKVDPLFDILDEVDGQEILNKIIKNRLEERNSYKSPIYKILFLLGQDDLENLSMNLQALYNRIKSNGQSMEEVKTITLKEIDTIDIPSDIDHRIEDDFYFLMSETRSNSKFNKLKEESIWDMYQARDFTRINRLDMLVEFQNYIGANKKNEDIVERLTENLNIALLEKEKEFLWAYEEILNLLLDIDIDYKRYKEKEQVLDFNDLEYLTYKLLKEDRNIREKYQEKFKYIMVDEFQDTNGLQKNIFYLLGSRYERLDRKNLFVVGDPKQSIYGFRGADVNVFKDVIKDIEEIDKNSPINMDKNFRSIDVIVEFVNKIFHPIMENYTALDFHHLRDKITDIEIIENENLEIPEGESESKYNKIYEANIIGDRIKELVASGKYNYRDFAILFRASTNDIVYEDALRQKNIPFYNIGGQSLYERQEIIDIINSLKAISSSYDIISNIGFLRGPMIGLDDESIYFIIEEMRSREESSIFNVLDKIELKNKDENNKLKEAYKILNKYKFEKDIYNLDDLLKNLLKDSNYIDLLFLYEDGEQRVNNVFKFMDILKEFLNKGNHSLEAFINHIENIDNLGIFENQRSIKSENANVVKLMTIHKSKGLQFPVVILPEMSRAGFPEVDNFVYNRDIGVGFKYEKNASLYEKVKSKNSIEDGEELKRILYVAMTRAEELLILGNQGKNIGFKKLLKDIDEFENVRYLAKDFKLEKIDTIFKKIDKDIGKQGNKEIEIPNLIEFENYNSRSFNSINISQFIEFKRCKRKFYIDYFKPLPDNFYRINKLETRQTLIEPMDRGNIIHNFIENYKEDDIDKLLEKSVALYNYEYNDEIKKELMPFIENYLEFYIDDYDKTYSEESFYIKIEDTYINGIIDRIYIKDNKAYIYDFKTNLVGDLEVLIEFYKPQIQLYGYAFEKVYGIPVVYGGLVFLKDNTIVEIDIEKELLEKNNKEIEDFIKFIKTKNKIEDYSEGKDCKNCLYKSICMI